MKNIKNYSKILAIAFSALLLATSCSEQSMFQNNTLDNDSNALPLKATSSRKYLVKSIDEYNLYSKSLLPGDTITLAKGAWTDFRILFQGQGTAENPIVLTVESPGETTIEGQSNLKFAGDYLVVDGLIFTNGYSATEQLIEFRNGTKVTANNCVLKNCVIENYSRLVSTEKDVWVNLWGRYNKVENCYFGVKTNLGTTVIVWPNGEGHNKNYHQISNNYFAGRPYLGVNGCETMRIGTSDYSMEISATIVEGNYFEYCNGEVELISIKSCENRILNNTFFESEGGVCLRHGNRNEVAGNYFIGNNKPNTAGVRVINEGHKVYNNYFYGCKGSGYRSALCIMKGVENAPLNGYNQVKNVEISFNTWVDCSSPWTFSYGTDANMVLLPVDVRIAHNLVHCPTQSTLIKATEPYDGISFENNLLVGKSGILQGEGCIQGSITSHNNANSYPVSYSDVKTSLYPYILSDIEGRIRSNPTSIGAFDFNVNARMQEQPTRSNTGPSWYNKQI